MLLFAGGPVWAMEWCPTPDGAPASQHIALACHRGMDDQHQVNKTYTGQGLVQLWDVGKLEYNSRYGQGGHINALFPLLICLMLSLSLPLQTGLPASFGLWLSPGQRLHLAPEVVSCRRLGASEL